MDVRIYANKRDESGGGDIHTETRRHGGETEGVGSEEMARRHNLRPVGGFPPEDREGWGLG